MRNTQETGKQRLLSNFNKSALTNHATTEIHIIDWEGATIIDKEPKKRTRQVKEAIWIRKIKTPMRAIMSFPMCTMALFVISTEEVGV